ncbi:MAG: transcriptional regulator, LacI family [Homoserinimonas sp.]|nr:transcriptional regulator, LacI family [Homoserinimonas sp.]
MVVTRADVARRAGVSPALVSYVLNPGSRPVSAAARARIVAAIEELDYRPNSIAQALRRSSSRTIGLLATNFLDPVVASLAHDVENLLYKHGYVTLMGSTDQDPARETEYARTYRGRNVDALLMLGLESRDAIADIAATGIPVMVLDQVAPGYGISSVSVESRAGAEAAVRHLIEVHGHSRIGCIAGLWSQDSHSESRVLGWRDALQKAGLDASDDLVVRTEHSRVGGSRGATDLLMTSRPTAIFTTSDVKAIGALAAIRESGLFVPSDVALVSYDGSQLAPRMFPTLTSVDTFLPRVAEVAVERLLAKIGKNGEGETHDVLPTKLVVRRSCGCTQ